MPGSKIGQSIIRGGVTRGGIPGPGRRSALIPRAMGSFNVRPRPGDVTAGPVTAARGLARAATGERRPDRSNRVLLMEVLLFLCA